jgi:sulfite exporter TauE/SafE
MCGPIVVSLSLNVPQKGGFVPHILYTSGRIITYAVLGAIMDATGSFTRVTANIFGIQKGALIFAGALIVIMGLAMTGWIPMGRIFSDTSQSGELISRGFKKFTRTKSTAAYLPLGLLLGLLPCGPVYTALIAAARTGMEAKSALQGILHGGGLMITYGLGPAPAILLVAKLAGMGWLRKRAIIYKIGAVLMILVGIYFIVRGVRY